MTENVRDSAGPRYPECRVRLEGTSANAASIRRRVCRGLEEYLQGREWDPRDIKEVVEEFLDDARSGNYESVTQVAFQWVNVE